MCIRDRLKDVTELIGKDVYVKPGKYYERLVNLDEELGGGIHIHKAVSYTHLEVK